VAQHCFHGVLPSAHTATHSVAHTLYPAMASTSLHTASPIICPVTPLPESTGDQSTMRALSDLWHSSPNRSCLDRNAYHQTVQYDTRPCGQQG
jgi:hypothetical protein